MRLAGIDLAWQTEKNPTAIAIAKLKNKELYIESIVPDIKGLLVIENYLSSITQLKGVAIDAPLIIKNQTGQRDCEKALAKDYASRKAACHPANLNLYPNADSVSLSQYLESKGFDHLSRKQWQIECYPHPAIIECFGLSERLLYKKGDVANRREGQIKYVALLKSLKQSKVISLKWDSKVDEFFNEDLIKSLKGRSLKTNEDVLDSIMCAYIAALYQSRVESHCYGNIQQGYIWIPHVQCAESEKSLC